MSYLLPAHFGGTPLGSWTYAEVTTVGMSTLSLGWLMVIKSAYCGVLAFVVGRWVMLRQLTVAFAPK